MDGQRDETCVAYTAESLLTVRSRVTAFSYEWVQHGSSRDRESLCGPVRERERESMNRSVGVT